MSPGSNMSEIAISALGLGVALGVGLLIGLERERNKRTGPMRSQAGVRTFALLGLAGAIATLIGTKGIYAASFFIALAMVVSYRRTRQRDPGLTTEMAMLVTFLLGILAMSMPELAGGIGVIVAVLLASRRRLHMFARQWLTAQELHDLLILATAAFVILPMLPDRTIDPWAAINPHRLWFLVVAVMSISSLGYLTLRSFGSRLGLAVAGLAGGFVSSTLTVAAMADRAREAPRLTAAAASAAVMSNVGTIVQLAVVVGSLSRALLAHIAVPLMVAGTTAVAASVLSSWRTFSSSIPVDTLAGNRPFKPAAVLRFVAVLAGIMLVSAIIRSALGNASLPWVMMLSGLADVHAAAASVAQATATGQVDVERAAVGVLIALTTNSLLKCTMALVKGSRSYALRVIPGVIAMVSGFAITLLTV
ncbi:Uncharacterized membrane protein, DUF4010 family [Dyella sp. OK004]|nr:Uncharacterized membrane protein, DUF4010 family [Dyella sp. OK004]